MACRSASHDEHATDFKPTPTMGPTRARYFARRMGAWCSIRRRRALVRIDHDQAFQQTTYLRYQRPNNGPVGGVHLALRQRNWWHGAVTSLDDALALSRISSSRIGFFCGSQVATLSSPITGCSSSNFGAKRLNIPAPRHRG